MKQVYEFKEGGKEMIPILGGKGGNLSEMVKIGLPIPYGIIVSTTACNQFFKDGKELSESLKEEILKNIQILESTTGKKIQSDNPLLVSVRSGAPISMPGMMDTILNVGFNDDVAQKMLEITGDEDFVYSSYLRFVQMFSEITEGIERKRFMELKSDNYKDQIKEGKQIYKDECGKEFPEKFEDQIFRAVKAIFNSWNNDRAILYRKLNNIDNNTDDSSKINMIISYDKPKFLRSEKIEGKEKGTILHSILELLDIVPFSTLIKLNEEEKKDIILQYIEKLRKEKIYSDEELEIVDVDVLLNYINTYIYTYLAKSVENNNIKIYKEKTIYLKLTKEDIEFLKTKYMISENLEEGQILQGVLDLYIVDEEKKEIYIVDYKTDKIFKEEYYKERYNVQIGIYEYSIFKQYGKDYNYKKIIYSTTMKKIIDLN